MAHNERAQSIPGVKLPIVVSVGEAGESAKCDEEIKNTGRRMIAA